MLVEEESREDGTRSAWLAPVQACPGSVTWSLEGMGMGRSQALTL